MNAIEAAIRAHIREEETVFVFPTQTAADLWADEIIKMGGASAVAMERFLAWDDFKGASIKSARQNKKAVPSLARPLFAAKLMEENAHEPFLRYLVTRDNANNSRTFAKWISQMFPSLARWKRRFEKASRSPDYKSDDEDADLLALYEKYNNFLEAHGRFDPAWETPPFNADGKKYIIFFPDILQDWSEYREILSASDAVELIKFNNDSGVAPTVDVFADSRTELRNAVLKIREAHEKYGVAWSDIAVSVPDMESYGPYVERELSLYEIPFVARASAALSASGAGAFFSAAAACVSSDFSFESVKTLLLNETLPWKDAALNGELINFGKTNNCLCGYEYGGKKIDVWEQSFRAPFRNVSPSEHVVNFYRAFKRRLSSLVGAKSFAEINKEYFTFRETFFDMAACPAQSDKIISRCIASLGELIDAELEFPDCAISNPYRFFTDYIADKTYLAQSENAGVSVLPYRTAAAAPFAFHIVVDASQSSLSVMYKPLSFLRDDKRRLLLGGDDENVSDLFIRLYAMNSLKLSAYFASAEKTFSGYGIPHAYFEENDLTKNPPARTNDFYAQEKSWLLQESEDGAFPEKITATAKNGFCAWAARQNAERADARQKEHEGTEEATLSPEVESATEITLPPEIESTTKTTLPPEVEKLLINKLYKDGELRVSYSALNKFYECPRAFLLDRALGIEEQNNEAELMNQYAEGDLNHLILQYYCTELKKQNAPLAVVEVVETERSTMKLPERYETILLKAIDDAIAAFDISALGRELLFVKKPAITQSMEQAVANLSNCFNGWRVAESEASYSHHPENARYFCYGKIDCLLKNDAGEHCLIDFKTTFSDARKKRLYVSDDVDTPDLQMPMYVHLLEAQAEPMYVRAAAFFNIGEAGKANGKKSEMLISVCDKVDGAEKSDDKNAAKIAEKNAAFEKTRERFGELLADFVKRVEARDFSIDKKRQDFDTCAACDYKALCRRTFSVGKNEA